MLSQSYYFSTGATASIGHLMAATQEMLTSFSAKIKLNLHAWFGDSMLKAFSLHFEWAAGTESACESGEDVRGLYLWGPTVLNRHFETF